MILFFYGADSYRMRQKLKLLKEKFVSSSLGDTNLIVLDGKTITPTEIIRQGLAIPFLSKTRLVILENFLHDGKKESHEKILEFIPKIPSSTVFAVIEEGLPDRRTALYKKLIKIAKTQEFPLLEDENLRRFIRKEVENRGGNIDSFTLIKLIEYVGSDLWRMTNEIDKLTAYSKQLTAENIELLIAPQVQANIFDLIEKTAAKNTEAAIKELYNLFETGQAEIYILTMIVFEYRNLLIVKDLVKRSKNLSRYELQKKSGLHPFVFSKTFALAQKYSLEDLKNIYRKLLCFESRLKVGKIEPKVALELLVFELTK